MFGHTEELAMELAKGVNSVKGVEATLWQASLYVSFPNAFHFFHSIKSQVCLFLHRPIQK